MPSRLERWVLMKTPLANRDFVLLAMGQFVSSIGDRVHRVALVWWIYNVTGSPSLTGLISLASMIPSILLSPYMGVLADKWDRRKIVYMMDFARGAIIAVVAALSFAGKLEAWHLVLSSVLVSACASLFDPAVSAMMPGIMGMENLQQAQGFFHTLMGMVGIIGPALGGFLVATIGHSAAFLLNAVSFVLSAISEIFIRYKMTRTSSDKGHFAQMVEAMRFTMGMPTIMGILVVFAMMNFALAPLGSLSLPYIVKDVLGKSSKELGLTMTMVSIGGLCGSLLMSALGNPEKRSVAITAGGAAMGAFMLFWPVLPHTWWLYTIMAVTGFSASLININAGVIFVNATPDYMLGKVSSFMNAVSTLMAPVGMTLFSLIAAADKTLVFYFPVASGFLVLMSTLGLYFIKGYKDI